MKRIFLILVIFTSLAACKKDDKPKVLTPKEQSKADDKRIIEYMESHKVEDYFVGKMSNNIDWRIIDLADDDTEDTETLFDLMGENVIETKYKDVDYKMYYYIKDKGAGHQVDAKETVRVDYNVFSLFTYKLKDRVDFTDLTVEFPIPGLIEGWKLGLEKFNVGIKPADFPGTSDFPYRKLIENPGRGILLVPSGIAYGPGSNILRFDIVVYDSTPAEEE